MYGHKYEYTPFEEAIDDLREAVFSITRKAYYGMPDRATVVASAEKIKHYAEALIEAHERNTSNEKVELEKIGENLKTAEAKLKDAESKLEDMRRFADTTIAERDAALTLLGISVEDLAKVRASVKP